MRKPYVIKIFLIFILSFIVFSMPKDFDQKIQERLNSLLKTEQKLGILLKRHEKLSGLTFKRYIEIRYDQELYMYAVETEEVPGMYILFDKDINRIYQWIYDLEGPHIDIFKLRDKLDIPRFLFEKINENRVAYPFRLKAYNTPFANLVSGIPLEEIRQGAFDEFYYNRPFLKAKNMIDSKKQIDHLNSLKDDNDLSFSGNPQNPAYKCYFYSLSSYLDNLLFIMSQDSMKTYIDFLNGEKIKGTSPRFLELCYRKLSEKYDRFKIMSEFFITDPVTKDGIPYSLKSAMEIPKFLDRLPEKIYDPIIPNNYFKRSDFSHLKKFDDLKTLLSTNENIFPDFNVIREKILSKRFLVGGIGLRYMGSELRTSAHAVVICGYARKDDKTFLIYQDTYGDKKDLLIIPATYFREIYYYDIKYTIIKKKDKNQKIIFLKNIFENKEKAQNISIKDSLYNFKYTKYYFDNSLNLNKIFIKPFFDSTYEIEL